MTSAASLVSISKTTDLQIGPTGETLRVTYLPTRLVVMLDEGNVGTDEESQARLLCNVVESWDMTGPVPIADLPARPKGSLIPDGQPVPVSVAVVKYLPFPLLQAITDAIAIDARPNLLTPNGSRRSGQT